MEAKLSGFIANGGHTSNHFMNEAGNVVCGTKCRFGWDAHTVVKFQTPELFYTDDFKSQIRTQLWKNHLPLKSYIGCKKCQAFIKRMIDGKV